MNVAKIVLLLLLFCNVIAISIQLFNTNAGWLLQLNIIGCVIFGVVIRELYCEYK